MSSALVPTPQPVFAVVELVRILDGDTIEVVFDKWHGTTQRHRIRFLEVDCPEKKDREAWKAATEFTTKWVNEAIAMDGMIVEGHRFDSFGRLLGYMWDDYTGTGLNHLLVAQGYGVAVPLQEHLRALGAV